MSNENKYSKKWKQLENESLDSISDVATDVFEAITKRKDRSPASEDEESDDAYLEEIKKKRKARYEVLKEKYKD
jgi:hypothetical protein